MKIKLHKYISITSDIHVDNEDDYGTGIILTIAIMISIALVKMTSPLIQLIIKNPIIITNDNDNDSNNNFGFHDHTPIQVTFFPSL